ncbi:hypothetical protein NDU88_002214 [Pleurodeles waltl]|uniref:Uncharacterized protein n=1 Tax=Pleurodeles waltl TaxID=8319 RepID=A0AAV7VAJ7_PLEWA|nr:hypothetical protein NDU88_002214 [Pleurodeles waltl]
MALRLPETSDPMQQRQHRAHSMTPRTLGLDNHKEKRTADWPGLCHKPELVAKNVVKLGVLGLENQYSWGLEYQGLKHQIRQRVPVRAQKRSRRGE